MSTFGDFMIGETVELRERIEKLREERDRLREALMRISGLPQNEPWSAAEAGRIAFRAVYPDKQQSEP